MKIVVWQSKDGWRWRLQGANGKVLASSEAYRSERSCLRTVEQVEHRTKLPVAIRKGKK